VRRGRRGVLVAAALLLAGAGPGGRVAVLATPASGTTTTLHLVQADATALPAPAARFDHQPWASVQAAVVPGTSRVLAVADVTPGPDRSFASGLVRVEPGAEPVWLTDRVVMASTPHPLPEGRAALVSRGRAGRDPGDGSYRVDELSVDVVELETGRARTLLAGAGYLLYIAGLHGGEAVIYRVGPDGADVVAVGLEGGATRVLVPRLPPYARDFTIEEGALVFLCRHETDRRRWDLWRVELRTGARQIAGSGARGSRVLPRLALPPAPDGFRLTAAGALP
jgi:hypothetical protein